MVVIHIFRVELSANIGKWFEHHRHRVGGKVFDTWLWARCKELQRHRLDCGGSISQPLAVSRVSLNCGYGNANDMRDGNGGSVAMASETHVLAGDK